MSAAATHPPVAQEVARLVGRARAAQAIADGFDQARIDELVAAAAWAILEPARNRELSELAVRDTGIGDVEDKVLKNHRKTLGLLRDLHGLKTVGVMSEDKASGIVEIGRPVGVVCAITPSTNPAATPANKIINSLKARNAVIVAPSPKGASTCARLVEFIHAELDRVGAPRDLVQMLPPPITKEATAELMRQCDLVVATGSQANVRAAYASGTPAFGVGAGNVASIVDETADVEDAAAKIVQSKTFDNATSCSSENSVVLVEAIADRMLAALARQGCVPVAGDDRKRLEACMWPEGKLSSAVIGQSAAAIAERAGLSDPATRRARVLLVEESGTGPAHRFSGEKLSPVLTVYRVPDFGEAKELVRRIYAYQGAGHSVSLHSKVDDRALDLGLTLPVARVIVNQVHVVGNGGSFSNGLPVSLSMGCGTWGRNNFSDNLNVRQYMNVTRIARPIPERVPALDDLLGSYFARWGR
ncbi:MAG TPA: aldehyde dehydrogenase family protein [Usitatibacter sp.]|jgi:sulfoacetaldehyde dehydrogenase|nr:aldehyde dehydrogenase family protein [Usitatibacter sp.]